MPGLDKRRDRADRKVQSKVIPPAKNTRGFRTRLRRRILTLLTIQINKVISNLSKKLWLDGSIRYWIADASNPYNLKVTIFSANKSKDPNMVLVYNAALYSKKMFWGSFVFKDEQTVKFDRQPHRKESTTVDANEVMFVLNIPIPKLGWPFIEADLELAFQDYVAQAPEYTSAGLE